MHTSPNLIIVNDEGRQHKTNHFRKFVHNQMKNQKPIIYQTEFGMSGNEEQKRKYVHK